MAILPVGIGPQEGGYQIERSLRFNSADSAYLNRTPGSAGNGQTFTISFWLKRSAVNSSSAHSIFEAYSNGGNKFRLWFTASGNSSGADNFSLENNVGSTGYSSTWNPKYRDPSAWYHFMYVANTTSGTASERQKVYVNGVLVSAYYDQITIPQNQTHLVNSNVVHYIGRDNGGNYFNGLITEFYIIDGSALDPTSFGEFNSDTGVWQPKAYTGSYGTNGFYLDFSDNSSTTALGYDAAGSNDWTPNNFSVTAGAGNDSLVDTPTPYGTDTGAGGEVRGNYATLNPIAASTNLTFSNGNLQVVSASSSDIWCGQGTMTLDIPVYIEGTVIGTHSTGSGIGIYDITQSLGTYNGSGSNVIGVLSTAYAMTFSNGSIKNSNSVSSYGSAFANGDTWMMAFDPTNGKIWWGKNGTWFNSGNPATGTNPAYSGITGTKIFGYSVYSTGVGFSYNAGQRPFAYTAPSGFKALCTQNLPEPTVVDGGQYFEATLWTGNGSTQTITTGIANDLVWTKDRGAAYDHTWFDVLRTPGYFLRSNSTSAEEYRSDSLTAFTSTGFSVGADSVRQNINKLDQPYVSWVWKANGAGVSNNAGTITSTVSANTTAGFSVVTYTGTGSNATVGHGLGVAPSFIIVKNRENGSEAWCTYHASLGKDKQTSLNSTAATESISNFWYNGVNSTVFGVAGGFSSINQSTKSHVAYCFAPVSGYSAFGSYTGNGSTDGPFVYTGFKPKFLLVKKSDGAENWIMLDGERSSYNVVDKQLLPNTSDAEGTITRCDFLSNGFKVRAASTAFNSGTMIYAAFAETPFSLSLAR